MKYLLENRLAPLTFSWGFVERTLAEVEQFVRTWRETSFREVRTEPVFAGLDQALKKLEPLVEPRAELLLSTASQWTACFDNSRTGGGADFGIAYICAGMNCRGVSVSCVPNTLTSNDKDARGVYGSVSFVLHCKDFLNYDRAISAINDGGNWAFDSVGEPLPFEDVAKYRAKRVADRLTPEMIEAYSAVFGIRLFDPLFYGPSGVVIKVLDRRSRDFRPLSLENAQREIGALPS